MFFKNKELIAENSRLQKEIEAYQTVQEELREEMLYIELNPDGRVNAINDLCSQATGYSIGELEGKSLESMMSPNALRKPAGQDMLGAIKTHRHWHGAVSFMDAKGQEMWVRGIVQPVDDANGNVRYIAFYMAEQTRNITLSNELRDMITALHRSSAVIEFNLDGTIITANDNFLKGMGYTLEQIEGKHHRIFCTEQEANSEEYKHFWRDLSEGKLESGRFKRIDSRGNEVWLEASYNPIRNEDGNLYKVVKFATVITEQMQREFAISEAANVAFNISQETGEQARKGNEVLNATVKAMNELTTQMGNASEGIKDLDEQSQKVADLVKSISGIADQTNLLALNAAIEAARAGDQGRGFAVVADEVRQLASRTSSATEEIVNVVVENRKLTENAVQLIEAGQEKARDALEYSTQSGNAMGEIQSGANEVVSAIGQFTKRL
ncbi:methyl-accepting chemotaxis protein [Alteromonas macleodii]|uniref:Methyl-accepting chemotaxis sensory transducer with Pas/Pac sensor n=1 Tax=Alteromonas macleodii TaxID=28108 RepID=A0A6T9XZ24_ALTMA|nr:methyl-accepting chemotaxis protein [Alteromonas macleodii]CAB9492686.1 Methyl-accepting chemotaxis sensory transducer with Pas/Pac sensor [Alteromonas macleodii]